ncbi:ABC transporter permease subunit [Neobacillus mesonae]|uniref:ABC transporter permease subunit n=1 Tax=Neobacillus mesonae TaxID=1193713 RepID=UPI002E1E170A|nr:ABC transporter permease subunit [Neobacillus mesonae]MED4206882.1 ABC transporter permease subunit [Neobacillus mesonae]
MPLIYQLGKSILAWLLATFIIIFIILMPRDVTFETTTGNVFTGVEYHYSFTKHKDSFIDFFAYIKDNKSLGEYMPHYPNSELLSRTMKKSLYIAIPALVLAFFLGVLKGILDYRLSKYKFWSAPSNGATWLFLSIPDFFVVVCIQIVLMYLYNIGLLPHITLFGSENFENIILCIIYLTIYPLFYIAKMTYTSLEDEEGKDYIRTAFSKGVPYKKVVYIHIFRNAIIKILQHLNTIALFVLSNLFIIEKFTDYRGAGFYFLKVVLPGTTFAVGQGRDLGNASLAISYTIIFTFIILLVHLISQICHYFLTPYDLQEEGDMS